MTNVGVQKLQFSAQKPNLAHNLQFGVRKFPVVLLTISKGVALFCKQDTLLKLEEL